RANPAGLFFDGQGWPACSKCRSNLLPAAPRVRLVVVAVRAVRVAVRELLLGRRAYFDDLDVERQRPAGERMIEIQVDVEVADLDDARLAAALTRVDDDRLPHAERAARREMLHRYALHGVLVALPVAFLGRHGRRELVAALLARELL